MWGKVLSTFNSLTCILKELATSSLVITLIYFIIFSLDCDCYLVLHSVISEGHRKQPSI